jgi:hypothetical protein
MDRASGLTRAPLRGPMKHLLQRLQHKRPKPVDRARCMTATSLGAKTATRLLEFDRHLPLPWLSHDADRKTCPQTHERTRA